MADVSLDFDLAARFLGFLRLDLSAGAGELNVLCLKGIGPDKQGGAALTLNKDQANRYNDTVALVFTGDDGARNVECYAGTVDPGLTSGNKAGLAHLTFGQHLYKKGTHRGHPALVSANGINRVWRDKNGNLKPDVGEAVYTGAYGINVHAGGPKDGVIGNWSEGCVNIADGWNGAPYRRFLSLVDVHGVKREIIQVTVWRGRELVRFAKTGATFRPIVCLGMKGPYVSELQEKLRAHALSSEPTVLVDGDFGAKTAAAVARFQKRKKLDDDGIVGDQTWAALLAATM